jgi:hypothetical protein
LNFALEVPLPRPNRDLVDFVVRLPRPVHAQLVAAAAASHRTMADLVRLALHPLPVPLEEPSPMPDSGTGSRSRRMPTGAGKTRIQIMLPDAYKLRLYARAEAEGLSVSEIVRRELRDFLFGGTVRDDDVAC